MIPSPPKSHWPWAIKWTVNYYGWFGLAAVTATTASLELWAIGHIKITRAQLNQETPPTDA
jgi:hypothetical protein